MEWKIPFRPNAIKKYCVPLPLPLFLSLSLLYLELVFHLLIWGLPGAETGYLFLFCVMAGSLAGGLLSLPQERTARPTLTVLTFLLCLVFCVELVYYAVFRTFLVLSGTADLAGQALDFTDVIWKNILGNLPGLLLLLLPAAAVPFLTGKRLLRFRQPPTHGFLPSLLAGAACYAAALLLLHLGPQTAYSPYDVYYHNVSADMTVEQFGVITMNRLDAFYAVAGKPSKSLQTAADTPKSASVFLRSNARTATSVVLGLSGNVGLNTMPVDFDAMTAAAPNKDVVQLNQYFQSQTGTPKNQYTGMFEGYNVIFITAEGFSSYVIDPERTPTLYRLRNEGFVFNHYYTPGWYASTSDGEYANLTGLLPTDGIVSMKRTGQNGNNMYFTLGRQLERLGYTLNAYHNNSYTYYGRDLSHPNMGYAWHGTGNWFQPETSASGTEYWPQSDLRLIEQSMPEYLDQEPFHTYYMSVSGHMMYSLGGNQMSARNYDLMKDLPYSETTRCYLAAQQELEKALTTLVSTLEEKGLTDHTVIVLSADHIPYDDKPVCDELAGHELESAIEWYQNDLIIWSGSMEEPVVVDKYCYDVDILPTLSNLLGLDYDSRLMLGQDILSSAEQLVCFPDRSFISGKCIYNAASGSVTPLTDEEVTQEYLDAMSEIVYNKFAVSELVLETDYYNYLQFK